MNSVFITANIFSDALSPLINLFGKILVAIHSVIGSWGFSIMAMTVLIRAALVPLTLKSIRSTQAMREFAPEIKSLQEKHKGDRQKLNEEMMKFYRENQINPFASCLPLLAQAPVFISLFYLLQKQLKTDICPEITSYAASIHKSVSQVACGQVPGSTDQKFLFIPDLTAKATGAVLITLIVLYVGSQLTSTLVMMQPTMDKTQRYIMFGLPLFLVVFVINFPAGLLVYWITTNLWTVGQQFVVKKTMPPIGDAAAVGEAAAQPRGSGGSAVKDSKKKSGGLMGRLLEASAAAQEESKARKKASEGKATGSKSSTTKPSSAAKPRSSKPKDDSKDGGDGAESAPGGSKGGPPPQRNKRKRTGRRR